MVDVTAVEDTAAAEAQDKESESVRLVANNGPPNVESLTTEVGWGGGGGVGRVLVGGPDVDPGIDFVGWASLAGGLSRRGRGTLVGLC